MRAFGVSTGPAQAKGLELDFGVRGVGGFRICGLGYGFKAPKPQILNHKPQILYHKPGSGPGFGGVGPFIKLRPTNA